MKALTRLTFFSFRKRNIINDFDSTGLAVLIDYDRSVGIKF